MIDGLIFTSIFYLQTSILLILIYEAICFEQTKQKSHQKKILITKRNIVKCFTRKTNYLKIKRKQKLKN